MDFYSLAPCPHCGDDVWKRMGGHHGIPTYYECLKCGMDTNRIKFERKRDELARAEAARLDEEAEGESDG